MNGVLHRSGERLSYCPTCCGRKSCRCGEGTRSLKSGNLTAMIMERSGATSVRHWEGWRLHVGSHCELLQSLKVLASNGGRLTFCWKYRASFVGQWHILPVLPHLWDWLTSENEHERIRSVVHRPDYHLNLIRMCGLMECNRRFVC